VAMKITAKTTRKKSNYISTFDAKNVESGFTLFEVVFALVVLALLFAGLFKTSAFTKFNAEQNLYEVSALNAALGVIEQFKSANYSLLTDPPSNGFGNPYFALTTTGSGTINLELGASNTLEVPVITESGGSTRKLLNVELTPTLQASSRLVRNLVNTTEPAGMWITVDYSWQHPRTRKTHTGSLRNMVSLVSTY